jgi:hypothetical protein
MTTRIPRKSAAHIVARIGVTLGVLLLAALLWQQLSEPNAVRSEASQPIQSDYLAYLGEDIWHALPTRR